MRDFLQVAMPTCIIVLIGLLLVMGLRACEPASTTKPESKPDTTFVRTRVGKTSMSVYSFDHDGHRFVATYRGGLIHHPGCVCSVSSQDI